MFKRAIVSLVVALATIASASAQTSKQVSAARLVDTYSYFKRSLHSLGAGIDDAAFRHEDSFMPLTSCNDATGYIGYDDEDTVLMKTADLAFDVLYMEAAMKAAGYPASLWKSDLLEYERSNLAAIDQYNSGLDFDIDDGSPAKQQLAKKLNDYNKTHRGRYKRVIGGAEGCGAGEINVTIRTVPSAQRVQYINIVKYNLCSFHGLDPRGPNCDLWVDYSSAPDAEALMSGKYKIRATWPDGTTVFRDLNVDDLSQKIEKADILSSSASGDRMATAYDDFLEVLKQFRTLSVTALGTGAAVPFFAYVAKIAPPWPPGVMLLTALTELVCLILVFQFLRTKGGKPVNRTMAILAPLLFLTSLGYLTVFSVFTYATPHTNERFTKGFVCKPEIQQLYADQCPLVSREALSGAQYTAENIWTDWSVELMQVFIATLWLASFVELSSLIGAFLVFQTQQPSRQAK